MRAWVWVRAMCTRSQRFSTGRAQGCQILNLRPLYGKSIVVGGILEAPGFSHATTKEQLQGPDSPPCPPAPWILP